MVNPVLKIVAKKNKGVSLQKLTPLFLHLMKKNFNFFFNAND